MLAVTVSLSLFQLGAEAFVDPKDYASPSGAYVLNVEPSARDGAGPGEYRMLREGKLVWATRLPFTLFEAAVTDTGATVGYAYDRGLRRTEGHFREVALGPDGSVVLDERTKRVLSRWGGCPTLTAPRALGLVVDEENDRFVIRILGADQPMELWRAFRISTGEKLAEFRPQEGLPRDEHVYSEIWSIRPVRGSELFLVHGNTLVSEPLQSGAFFALIELGGKVVWQHELPHDYEVEGKSDELLVFRESVRERGAIVDLPAPRTFDLWFVREEQRVRFQTCPDPGSENGWAVVELRRHRWTADDQDGARRLEGRAR